MVLICVKLAVKLKKLFFLYIAMAKLKNEIFEGALVGAIAFAFVWVIKKVHDQNEDIKKMFSRLEDFEEKLSQCEEKLSQLKK